MALLHAARAPCVGAGVAAGEHHGRPIRRMAHGGREWRAHSAHSRAGVRHGRGDVALRSGRPVSIGHRRIVTARGRSDAIVVGAGIVGAACAAALARRRLARDDSRAGVRRSAGTTSVGMGHIVVDGRLSRAARAHGIFGPALARARASTRIERAEVDAMRNAVGGRGSQRSSTALGPSSASTLRRESRRELLDDASARGSRAESAARSRRERFAFRTTAWCIRPGVTIRAARSRDERAAPCSVKASKSGDRCRTVCGCNGETLRADVVVNAAGRVRGVADAGAADRAAQGAPGDHGSVPATFVDTSSWSSATSRARTSMTTESVAFNVQPRSTGQVLIGSSRELVGWDASINHAMLRRMLARAVEFVPGLRELSVIRCWTGFRPATPDKLPLIGPWEGRRALWIAAGHEGLGITTSLATARLIADQLAGRVPAIDPSPFWPSRVLARSRFRGSHVTAETIEIVVDGRRIETAVGASVAARYSMREFSRSVVRSKAKPARHCAGWAFATNAA